MTLNEAKKILDAAAWILGMSTRRLPPEERGAVKSALNLYSAAGKRYESSGKTTKKSGKTKS